MSFAGGLLLAPHILSTNFKKKIENKIQRESTLNHINLIESEARIANFNKKFWESVFWWEKILCLWGATVFAYYSNQEYKISEFITIIYIAVFISCIYAPRQYSPVFILVKIFHYSYMKTRTTYNKIIYGYVKLLIKSEMKPSDLIIGYVGAGFLTASFAINVIDAVLYK